MAENLKDDEAQFESLDALFGASLDDIADLASFETPKSGTYVLKVSTGTKKINKKDAVTADFEVVETVELKDDTDVASKPGTKFNIAFIMGNKFSEGRLKQFLIPFAEKFGEKNVGVLIRDTIKEVIITCQLGNRPDKDDPEKIYAVVKNIEVA